MRRSRRDFLQADLLPPATIDPMKKIIAALSFFALILIVASPVFAETATRSGKINREEFRARLSAIRDAKKKAIVERVDQRLAQINTNRTGTMTRHLTKIEEILDRIETRADTIAASGKDVGAVRTAITTARTAIASAKTTVAAQAAKTYAIDITTEANLGSAMSSVRTAFAKDLQAAHQSVVTARKSVRDVLTALAKVVGEKLTNTVEK